MGRQSHPALTYARKTVERDRKHTSRQGTGKIYQLEVGGELSPRYAAAFEGMQMETGGGRTVLTGGGIDQFELHGIIDRIGDLGLEILSVKILPEDDRKGSPRTLPSHTEEVGQRDG